MRRKHYLCRPVCGSPPIKARHRLSVPRSLPQLAASRLCHYETGPAGDVKTSAEAWSCEGRTESSSETRG